MFEANVFKLLVSEGLITAELIAKMRTWKHSGFHVYAGPTITHKEDAVRVGLYIVRAPASASRLQLAEEGLLKYLAKGSIPTLCTFATILAECTSNATYLLLFMGPPSGPSCLQQFQDSTEGAAFHNTQFPMKTLPVIPFQEESTKSCFRKEKSPLIRHVARFPTPSSPGKLPGLPRHRKWLRSRLGNLNEVTHQR